MKERLTRQEVPEELTWNLKDIFPNDQAWEAALAGVLASLPTVTSYQGRLHEGGAVFFACLEALEKLSKEFLKVRGYAYLKQSTDGSDPANQALLGRSSAAGAQFAAQTAFVRSEALALPDGTLERHIQEEPRLQDFERQIQQMLAGKPYLLSPETEKALASLGEVLGSPSMIYNRSKASDMTFSAIEDSEGQTHPMSFALYESVYEQSADPVLRRNAYASFVEGLKGYQNTYGATWGTEVRKNVVLAKLRGFGSATHMLLHDQEVSEEVYHRLHDVILTELAPHMRRYARLRREVLGLDKLLYCDIEAPLDPGFAPPATFESAKEIILSGVSVLGEEYQEIIRDALNNRWIDLADNIGNSTVA